MRFQYIPITVAFLVGATTSTFAQQNPRDVKAAAATSSPASPRVINRLDVPAEAALAPALAPAPAPAPAPVAGPGVEGTARAPLPAIVTLPSTPPLVPRPGAVASEPDAAPSSARPADTRAGQTPPRTASNDITTEATKVQRTPVAKAKPKAKPVTLTVQVDLTTQRAHVAINGVPSHSWPISSGKAGYETPTGTFRPQWMAKSWFSRTYDDAPMPHSVFFNSGIAFHGTTSVRLLGRPASRGCIRLAPKNAETLYGLVRRHGMTSTRVTVVGRTPVPPAVASSSRSRRARATAEVRPRQHTATAPRRVYGLQPYVHTRRPHYGGYYGAYAPPPPRYRPPVTMQQRRYWPGDQRAVRRPAQPWGWTQAGRPSPYWRY